ncbi:Hsp20/alpha crystallin family protein [Arthrobacter sp. CJ23]|uniref:Hsp20/alpha crystallin family protein n=1 Tax=Arthrobacter sp. CJ23 TaxID=2972479 RepID=UPI00215C2428|nr:Hsp20/alpha crystallin family protein [Arthrobacter sp. CJ23]UVJ41257.1 Hsp20/alpha crystallin family protein [Arthrobacter sp. CJ23]
MRGNAGAHQGHLQGPGHACGDSGPVIGAGVGGQDGGPFGAVPGEGSASAGRACGRGRPPAIRAERRETSEQKEEGSYPSEFRYGSMFRSILLPQGVKVEDISASFKDGVLEVRAPMPEGGTEAAKQKIQISRS